MPQPRAAVILAAGKGTRMKSATPKVLHVVGGKTMLAWTVDAARRLGADEIVVVVGAHSPEVGEAARALGAATAVQDPPLGTGHAVNAAREALSGFSGDMIVLYADTPLVGTDTLAAAFDEAEQSGGLAVIGFEAVDPFGYGRLIIDAAGGLSRIVEEKDASEAERAVTLCNSGVMAAPAALMFSLLADVRNDNAKGEYYLTDIVGLANQRGVSSKVVRGEEAEFLGVNDRLQLAEAEAMFQTRMREAAMLSGVTLTAPETVFFSHDTFIESDVLIEPNVVFGPRVHVENGVSVRAFSHIEGARVRSGAVVGPYARLRPGADIGADARVGNFVEVKNTTLGPGAKASHLTYLGDAEIGARVNIGAGTITCNYDGYRKHKTVIGDGAFIGSDTSFVAPVRVGPGAMTGSGSVITSDVPENALSIARSRQSDLEGWALRYRAVAEAENEKA